MHGQYELLFSHMLDFLSGLSLNPLQWAIVLSCAILIGMSKTGLSGLD